ncbi:hypothetical protein KBD81_00915 [Candidatus Woesebacteria bacterium]|nr:hypothetical protein [Candidatus Woesebacteria bacterium]
MELGKLFQVILIPTIVVGIGFAFRDQIQETFFCSYPDRTFCEFMKSEWSPIQGTFKQTESGKIRYEGRFNWDSAAQEEVVYDVSGKEKLHLFRTSEDIYLKDYEDDSWWQQTLEQSTQYQTTLPFEPSLFFSELRTQIEAKGTIVKSSGTRTCDGRSCTGYVISSRARPDTITLYLTSGSSSLAMIEMEDGEKTTVISSQPLAKDIVIPNRSIKVAAAGQNIYLEMDLDRTNTSTTPQYIREFEETRIEAEQSGIVVNAPQYKAPTPTPTSIVTP